MLDFLEGLEANIGNILEEADAQPNTGSGKTFAEIAKGGKWGYIPKPKNGKGFGSTSSSLLFIKELGEDSWELYVLKNQKGKQIGTKSDKTAAANLRKRPSQKTEAKEIARFMELTEQILAGETLNEEAVGNVEGWTEMLKNTEWQAVKAPLKLNFGELLKKCVAAVSNKSEGGSTAFLN